MIAGAFSRGSELAGVERMKITCPLVPLLQAKPKPLKTFNASRQNSRILLPAPEFYEAVALEVT